MTVLTWDGKILAADRMVETNGSIYKTTKVSKFGDYLIGFSGRLDVALATKDWFERGQVHSNFPTFQNEGETVLLVIRPDYHIMLFYSTPHPIIMLPQKVALGCGADYALGAMACGKSAKAAVKIASRFDAYCGCGVDVVTFESKTGKVDTDTGQPFYDDPTGRN